LIKNLESKISYLEDLLERISRNILANVLYEEAPPSKLLADSENYIENIKMTSEEIRDLMFILKPERAPSIRRVFKEFIQPINSFVDSLKESEQAQSSLKISFEYLRKALAQSQSFINLAKDVAREPSRSIAEVLRLKEISDAKNYISKVYVPEAIYMRLEYFKRNLESFKTHALNLEQSVRELLKYISKLEEEISKFQQQ